MTSKPLNRLVYTSGLVCGTAEMGEVRWGPQARPSRRYAPACGTSPHPQGSWQRASDRSCETHDGDVCVTACALFTLAHCHITGRPCAARRRQILLSLCAGSQNLRQNAAHHALGVVGAVQGRKSTREWVVRNFSLALGSPLPVVHIRASVCLDRLAGSQQSSGLLLDVLAASAGQQGSCTGQLLVHGSEHG